MPSAGCSTNDLFDADELAERGYLWNRLEQLAASRERFSAIPGEESRLSRGRQRTRLVPGRRARSRRMRTRRSAGREWPLSLNRQTPISGTRWELPFTAPAASPRPPSSWSATSPGIAQTIGYDWVFLAMCRQRLGQAVSGSDRPGAGDAMAGPGARAEPTRNRRDWRLPPGGPVGPGRIPSRPARQHFRPVMPSCARSRSGKWKATPPRRSPPSSACAPRTVERKLDLIRRRWTA